MDISKLDGNRYVTLLLIRNLPVMKFNPLLKDMLQLKLNCHWKHALHMLIPINTPHANNDRIVLRPSVHATMITFGNIEQSITLI